MDGFYKLTTLRVDHVWKLNWSLNKWGTLYGINGLEIGEGKQTIAMIQAFVLGSNSVSFKIGTCNFNILLISR
jgi:hypothetical protein